MRRTAAHKGSTPRNFFVFAQPVQVRLEISQQFAGKIMDTKTKIAMGLAVICAILGFIPSTEGALFLLKLIFFTSLIAFIYYSVSGRFMEKTIQVIVRDVRSDRKNVYRNSLLNALKAFGEPIKLQEDPDEVAVEVKTKRSLEEVKKSIDHCKLKIQFKSTFSNLKYTSLEAAAEMLVAITGSATPGSTVTIEGIKQKIKVEAWGEFAVKVPLSLIRKNEARGYIPAKCKKGNIEDDIQIPIPK